MQKKLVLEFGCNHNGDVMIAKEMIDKAAELGAWAVKFQKRDIEGMSLQEKNKYRNLNNSFGSTYYEHRKFLEFDYPILSDLQRYAKKNNLKFICTAFDAHSARGLKLMGCDFIKLPSQLYLDLEMFEILKDQRVITSTGMHTLPEIISGDWFERADCVMFCNSIYPHSVGESNLINLFKIIKLRSGIVGYSSHGENGEEIFSACLLGADIIERHFTLDKKMKGSDHATVSSEPYEIKKILIDMQKAEDILGEEKLVLSKKEKCIADIFLKGAK